MKNVGRSRSGRGTLIALLLTAFATNIPVAFAADSETAQQRVRLGDLNLNEPSGVAVAYNRLLSAAQRVCPFTDSADFWLRVTAQPCLVQAISQAIDSIGSPTLRTYAQSQRLFRLQWMQETTRIAAKPR
jgi:UrcA family protein